MPLKAKIWIRQGLTYLETLVKPDKFGQYPHEWSQIIETEAGTFKRKELTKLELEWVEEPCQEKEGGET